MCDYLFKSSFGGSSERPNGDERAELFQSQLTKVRSGVVSSVFFCPDSKRKVQARWEISPNYAVMRRREIRLTRELFPDLIGLVHHPVDRMWSALRRHWACSYLNDLDEVGKDGSSMLGYADQRLADAFGDYRAIYWNWTSVFDENRILLLGFDRMENESGRTVTGV